MSRVSWCRGKKLSEVEKETIVLCLKANEWNQVKASIELGVSVRTIHNKIKLYGGLEKCQKLY